MFCNVRTAGWFTNCALAWSWLCLTQPKSGACNPLYNYDFPFFISLMLFALRIAVKFFCAAIFSCCNVKSSNQVVVFLLLRLVNFFRLLKISQTVRLTLWYSYFLFLGDISGKKNGEIWCNTESRTYPIQYCTCWCALSN